MRLNRQQLIAEARIIAGLAFPVVLTSLNWTLMQMMDVAFVGQVSSVELGYLGAGRSLTFISIVMGIAAMSGVLVYTSRADGAGDLPATGEFLRSGLALGLLIGLIGVTALWFGARSALAGLDVAPAMVPQATRVVQAMALAFPGQLVLVAASYFLEGVSRPGRVMAVNLATLPLNGVLAWAWVGGHLGLPALGAVGASLATAVASTVGGLLILVMAWTLPRAAERNVRDVSRAALVRAITGIPALVRFGLVPCIASGLEIAGFSWLIVLSTQLGVVATGAFQIVFALHNFCFSLALGVGSAAGVRVGNAVGARTPELARPRALIAVSIGVVLMALLAGSYALFAPFFTSLFSDDASLVALAMPMLVLLAPFMLFDGAQVAFMFALRSLGDQVVAGVNGIVGFFIVTGGLGWLLVALGAGPMALIWASGIGMLVTALLNGGRFWWITEFERLRTAAPA
ncbi:MAG: MATE family efflux transporter [Sphingomonadaceae bacterium]|nr:MATE family efflux transporter [Sphingomonadaceae bacterium]